MNDSEKTTLQRSFVKESWGSFMWAMAALFAVSAVGSIIYFLVTRSTPSIGMGLALVGGVMWLTLWLLYLRPRVEVTPQGITDVPPGWFRRRFLWTQIASVSNVHGPTLVLTNGETYRLRSLYIPGLLDQISEPKVAESVRFTEFLNDALAQHK